MKASISSSVRWISSGMSRSIGGSPLVVATVGVRSAPMSGSRDGFTEIVYEEAGHVGVLTLNRPEPHATR